MNITSNNKVTRREIKTNFQRFWYSMSIKERERFAIDAGASGQQYIYIRMIPFPAKTIPRKKLLIGLVKAAKKTGKKLTRTDLFDHFFPDADFN